MRLGGRIAAAIEVVGDIEARRRPVSDALKDWGLSHRFAGSGDRAAIGNIVYDVLRRRRSLAWRMEDDAGRAAVFGAVLDGMDLSIKELAAQLEGDRFAPKMPSPDNFSAFRTRQLAQAPDAIRADVPDWIAPHFQTAFADEWVDEASALSQRPPLDLRVNTLLSEREAVQAELEPFAAMPMALSPVGLRIGAIERDGRHPNVQVEAGFQQGRFEIQDEGSQLAALLSGAAGGTEVLDFCAGAGGKSLALAAAMGGEGRIHAFDADRQRLAPIHERVKRAEARNIEVHDPRDDLSALQNAMDLVLVDAPCTGTGTWRRRPDAKWRLSDRQVEKRTGEQDRVLDRAASFVASGGRLIYITCSLLPDENEQRIESFLTRHGETFDVADAAERWNKMLPGRPSTYHAKTVANGRVLTLTPRTTGTDGFFFAELRRR